MRIRISPCRGKLIVKPPEVCLKLGARSISIWSQTPWPEVGSVPAQDQHGAAIYKWIQEFIIRADSEESPFLFSPSAHVYLKKPIGLILGPRIIVKCPGISPRFPHSDRPGTSESFSGKPRLL